MLRETYNYHLYRRRCEKKLSRHRMAKAIGISGFTYRMIECGYWKPSKKAIDKISAYLEEDYSLYLEGASTNPTDLPEKTPMKIVRGFYHVMGSWITRGILIALTAISSGVFISSFIVNDWVGKNETSFYDQRYIDYAREITDFGAVSIGVVGEFQRPEIYEVLEDTDTGRDKIIAIKGHYKGNAYLTLQYNAIYRTETHRATASFSSVMLGEMPYYVSFKVVNFETTKTQIYDFFYNADGSIRDINTATEDPGYLLSRKKAGSIIDDFNHLIRAKTSSDLTVTEALTLHSEAEKKASGYQVYALLADLLGMIGTAVFLFATIFAFLYGRRKGQKRPFLREYFEVETEPVPPTKPLPKDWKIAPFLPETLLEVVGIILVFLGSLRLAVYVMGFFGFSSMGETISNNYAQEIMSVFVLGMFLLYFLDFDLFLEDKRVARNIFLYAIVFFCLYRLEIALLDILDSSFAAQLATSNVIIPNMFGSISCYFMITFFLFYTPQSIKKPYQMVLWRCLTIIPVAWLAVSWVLFHGDGVWFDLGWSRSVKYLFNGERLPFTALAVAYLVGYYFIRLFFEKKYGKDNAQCFFNSNRFLWIKNTYVALIIGAVALVEALLSGNATAKKLDIGNYYSLIILAPILFFYHPHKGPRNKVVDYTTLTLYILALAIAYLSVAFLVVVGIGSTMVD